MQLAYSHDLYWPPAEARSKESLIYILQENSERLARGDRSFNQMAVFLLAVYLHSHVDGVQVWVSKEVSDDLSHSDISDPDFESVPWLGPSMEFVFEDRTLPSFVMHRNPVDRAIPHLPLDLRERNEEHLRPQVNLFASGTDGSLAELNLNMDAMNRFASGEEVDTPTHDGTRVLDADDLEGMHWMALMAFKVLFFASIKEFAPRIATETPSKAQGGKPGFRNRPKTNRFSVQYLPRQKAALQEKAAGEGNRHAFLGRRGHLRTYQHARFKQMRGKRVFIAPIPGPEGSIPSRKKFKVVLPCAA